MASGTVDRSLHFRHGRDVLGRHRLLEEEQAKGLERADDLECGVGVPPAVDVDGDLVIRPARRTHRLDLRHGAAQFLWRDLPIEGGRAERVELATGESLVNELLGASRQRLGSVGDALGPAVGVNPQRLADLAAQEVVDRHAELLANDVVEGRVDRADRGHHHTAHSVVVEGAIHPVPQLFDVPGPGADNDVAQVPDGGGDRLDAGEVGAFAPADEAVGRLDPHEEPWPVTPHAGEQVGLDLDDPERVTRFVAPMGPKAVGPRCLK